MPGMHAPPLPRQFPCWVKAIYSWGGETKRDLGFVEGDLIECLNAGDGSWWMGRLKRDKRQVGLFPSNFVEHMEDFRPTSPAPSAVRSRAVSPAGSYRARSPHPPIQLDNFMGGGNQHRAVSPSPYYQNSRGPSPNPYQQQQQQGRGPSPNPYQQQQQGRGPSPNPYQQQQQGRGPSPNPYQQQQGRGPSPNPYQQQQQGRGPSPNPYQQQQQGRGPSPNPYQQHSRGPSPNPYQQHSRGPSPNPYQMSSRGPSPNPYHQQQQHQQGMRATSPAPYHRSTSPYPNSQRAASPNPYYQDQNGGTYQQRAHTPALYQPVASQPYGVPNPDRYDCSTPNPTQQQQGRNSRCHTPNPQNNSMSQGPSPSPYHMPQRAISPAPFRAVSPTPARMSIVDHVNSQFQGDDTPPPPPPVHGRGFHSRAASPAGSFNHGNGRASPMPSRGPSPMLANTPSPLRSAMDDVMSSLDDMSMSNEPHTWGSGQDFDTPTRNPRAHTALGLRQDRYDEDVDTYGQHGTPHAYRQQQPQQQNEHRSYADALEERLHRFEMSQPATTNYYAAQDHQQQPYNAPLNGGLFDDTARPSSSIGHMAPFSHKKSFWELKTGTSLERNGTNRSTGSSTANSSTSTSTTSTAPTSYSLMSGISAGGFSATSAGSLARHKARPMSVIDGSPNLFGGSKLSSEVQDGPMVGSGGVTYHSGPTPTLRREKTWGGDDPGANVFGGLSTPSSPSKRKSGFFKKIIASAKASTATARSVTHTGSDQGSSAVNSQRIAGIGGGNVPIQTSGNDWVQVRRDVNRSNTLSRNERLERQEKQEMMGQPILRPIDSLDEDVHGDEAGDGGVVETPADIAGINMSLVDKSARFVNSLPAGTTPAILANNHICRPYRSDVQRLRAMFTWTAEKVAWEHPIGPTDDSLSGGLNMQVDCMRVIQTHRGTSEEVAVLIMQMCHSVGLGCEVVRGYLKVPGEVLDYEVIPRPNHFWNAVVIDGEWRIMDASLASPTHPKRPLYSSAQSNLADFFYFLTKPSQACYTHIPMNPAQQHLVPPLPISTLLALPCATSVYFRSNLELLHFDTSLTRIEDLEVVQLDFKVPLDVEVTAEVEAKGFATDIDGDFFESGEIVKKGALAQVTWEGGWGKTYRVKAVLPGDEGQGVLKVYAGPRGLMHSIKDNPHALAFAVPLTHTGENPPYNFVIRHPTPHAQRQDLYVISPQNFQLAYDNTYLFSVRSRNLESLMSKAAKLAVQQPSGKIIRLNRKGDTLGAESGQIWELSLKVAERGLWRALVMADRSARWCVFAEWACA